MEKNSIRNVAGVITILFVAFFAFLLGRCSVGWHKGSSVARTVSFNDIKSGAKISSGPSLRIQFSDHVGDGDFRFDWVDYKRSNKAIAKVNGVERTIDLEEEMVTVLHYHLNRVNLELYNEYYAGEILDESESVAFFLYDDEGEHALDLPPMDGMPDVSVFVSTSDSESPFEPDEMQDLYTTTYSYNLFINIVRAIVYEAR